MFEHDMVSATPPPHALLQHTASTQNPDAQSLVLTHGVPSANNALAAGVAALSSGGTC
jgi:hypothetical protein